MLLGEGILFVEIVVALVFIFVSLHLRSVLQFFFVGESCTRTRVSESKPECGFLPGFVDFFQWHVFVLSLCGQNYVMFIWLVCGFGK